jgi:hypothetical protein
MCGITEEWISAPEPHHTSQQQKHTEHTSSHHTETTCCENKTTHRPSLPTFFFSYFSRRTSPTIISTSTVSSLVSSYYHVAVNVQCIACGSICIVEADIGRYKLPMSIMKSIRRIILFSPRTRMMRFSSAPELDGLDNTLIITNSCAKVKQAKTHASRLISNVYACSELCNYEKVPKVQT